MHSRTYWKTLGRFAAVLLAVASLATSAQAATISFDFTGSQGGSYGVGTTDSRTFTVDGFTVTATAYSYYSGSFHEANLGRWDSGLAVCNSVEMSSGCQSGEHQVTNNKGFDFVLFEFSGPADPLEVRIRTTNDYDLDVTYWSGTGPVNLVGDGTANNYSGSSSTRTVYLNSGVSDWLFFGASTSNAGIKDGFKIKSLEVDTYTRQVPEPASMLLFGVGALVTLAGRRYYHP